jgi:mRNA interferase MazF
MFTMPCDFGDVVVVKFPFTNQTALKQRPAVVVSSQSYNGANRDVILMAITSQLSRQGSSGEIWIADWRSAKLLKPSAIKPVIATVQQSLVMRSLGKLQPADKAALRTMLQAILG